MKLMSEKEVKQTYDDLVKDYLYFKKTYGIGINVESIHLLAKILQLTESERYIKE